MITLDFGIPDEVLRRMAMFYEHIAATIHEVTINTDTALKSSVSGRRRK